MTAACRIGLWSSPSSPVTVEVIAGLGFAWLPLDTERLAARSDSPQSVSGDAEERDEDSDPGCASPPPSCR